MVEYVEILEDKKKRAIIKLSFCFNGNKIQGDDNEGVYLNFQLR